jgi:CheY-like chemotaxis protein
VTGRPPLVLVVDGDPVCQLVLVHMLDRLGCTVIVAGDVAAGCELTATPGLDLVMADYAMPGGSGLELLARLRSTCQEVPFVVMTGIVEHTGLSPDAGVDARLTKPLTTRELTACLRQVWPYWTPP